MSELGQRHPLTEIFDRIAELLKPAVEKLREIMRDCAENMKRNEEYRKHRAESLKPTTPTRIDTRHVTHTDSKPPRPATLYRRRTP